MARRHITIILIVTMLLSKATVASEVSLVSQIPAFPGAEGAGMYTTGGRGGKVIYITSLEDNNEPGTLRWAIRQKGARTILFKVSGQIRLKSPLKINNGDLTIAGQSAPGDGICISDYETSISANNVIIRFIRFRLGDKNKQAADALSGYRNENIIIDHCSMSWGVDELSSFYDNKNFTMQWCFIAESLANSIHPKGKHGYGGIWGGQNASFHHNLIAHNDSRNPRFCGSRYSNEPDLEKVDFRNNVIYNWGANNIYAGEGGSYNIVGNYFKPGPASGSASKRRILNPDADDGKNNQPAGVYGHFYIDDNFMYNNAEISNDNKSGIDMGSTFEKFAPNVKLKDILSDKEFQLLQVTTDSVDKAFKYVLSYGGASLARDMHDIRYVKDVIDGSYTFEGSSGSTNGLIDSQEDVGGWPVYKVYNEYSDSDKDGTPDGWLDKNYPGKSANDLNSDGYTYLEVYLNSLVNHLIPNTNKDTSEKETTLISSKSIKKIVVAKNGDGDFKSVQEAINSVRAFDPDYSYAIFVKEGIYYEKIVIHDYLSDLRIVGEDVHKTIISNNDHALINNMGTFQTYTMQVRGNDITIENITIENNAPMVAQAVALHTEGNQLIFKNCRFLGNQDTIYTGGVYSKLYFQDCYIEGTTDFIFGPSTAWFENCAILCKKNSYITASSTPKDVEYGYIFNNCNVTVSDEVTSVYLGRPWRPYAMTLLMNTVLPEEINPLGWNNWNNIENEKTARYSEYNNKGKGSNSSKRVNWSRQLTSEEALDFTLEEVMGCFYSKINNQL